MSSISERRGEGGGGGGGISVAKNYDLNLTFALRN